MIKKLLPFLLIPALLFSAENLTYVYNFETPVIKDNIIYLQGCRPSMQGFAPMVAVKPVVLLVPQGSVASSFEVVYSDMAELPGEYYIRPHIPDVNLDAKGAAIPYDTKSAVYENNAYFPQQTRSTSFRMQYKNGHPILVSTVYPSQYNPVTGKIRYYKTITVKSNLVQKRSSMPVKCDPGIRDLLKTLIDNTSAADNLPLTLKDSASYEYLIITTDALKSAFDNFIAFNKRRCFRTNVQTISAIKSTMTGRDDAEKMRAYIKQEYKNNDIVYVLLGGDESPSDPNDVPDRGMRAVYYDHHVALDRFKDEKDVCADMYFSTLDGDWKTDNTGTEHSYYGEWKTEDMYWDVYATRWTVTSVDHVNAITNKTIKYSETPVTNAVNNLLLAGEFLWSTWGQVYGDEHMEEYLGTCTKNGYTTYGFPTATWTNVKKFYEKQASWTIAQLRSSITTNKISWMDHLGHGNQYQAFKENTSGVTTTNYATNGTNGNFFIITTGACDPCWFDGYDCLLERFLKLSTGAVAVQGFTRTGLEDDDGTNGAGQRIRRYFHDAIFNPNKKIHYLEMAAGHGKEFNADIILANDTTNNVYHGALRFIAYGLNFLGDPALSFWTMPPQTLQVSPSFTGAVFNCDTKGAYSWVALVDKNGNILTTQLTGQNGLCKIDEPLLTNYINQNPGTKMKLRIKAHNFLPYEGDIDLPTSIHDNQNSVVFTNGFSQINKTLSIRYSLTDASDVTIALYSAKGSLVKTLLSQRQAANNHVKTFDISDLSSGIYYCRFTANTHQTTNKVFVTK